MTLTPKSPACILYAAMNPGVTPERAAESLNTWSLVASTYISAAKAVRDATLNEAAEACRKHQAFFSSEQYASNQPASSFGETFACMKCAEAITAMKDKTP